MFETSPSRRKGNRTSLSPQRDGENVEQNLTMNTGTSLSQPLSVSPSSSTKGNQVNMQQTVTLNINANRVCSKINQVSQSRPICFKVNVIILMTLLLLKVCTTLLHSNVIYEHQSSQVSSNILPITPVTDAEYNNNNNNNETSHEITSNNETNATIYDENASWMDRLPPWQKAAIYKKAILDDPREEPLLQTNDDNSNNNNNTNQSSYNHDDQQVVILAGPAHSNTKQMQTQFWKWTTHPMTKNFTEPILQQWVWPVPLPVVHAEFYEMEHQWTPADVYYTIIEAMKKYVIRQRLRNGELDSKKVSFPTLPGRMLFQKYSLPKIFRLFRESMEEYWNMGYNLILGSEGFNLIVSHPEYGDEMIQRFSEAVIPSGTIPGKQITAVVLYRSSKVEHFLQSWKDVKDISFRDWIVYGMTMMFSLLDALGIVEMILKNTQWDVAILDTKGLEQSQWDTANYIACHIMKNSSSSSSNSHGISCDENGMIGFESEKDKYPPDEDPSSVQEDTTNNIPPEKVLKEMEQVFLTFDCNYKSMIQEYTKNGRLTIHHNIGLDDTMKRCNSIKQEDIPDRDGMRQRIIDIVEKY